MSESDVGPWLQYMPITEPEIDEDGNYIQRPDPPSYTLQHTPDGRRLEGDEITRDRIRELFGVARLTET